MAESLSSSSKEHICEKPDCAYCQILLAPPQEPVWYKPEFFIFEENTQPIHGAMAVIKGRRKFSNNMRNS